MRFAGNYSNDKQFSKSNWLCRCGEREQEVHLAKCQVYSDISARYADLEEEDSQLVTFLREVLQRRDLLERLEREELEAPLAVEEETADVMQAAGLPVVYTTLRVKLSF